MSKTSFVLPDEIEDKVEAELGYGDTKAEYFRQAIRLKLQIDPMLDELFEPEQKDKRIMFVEQAVREKIDEIKENGEYSGPGNYRPGE